MWDGQNDIACLDILTKCIKLMDLQGYMASKCLLLSKTGKSYQAGSIIVSWNVHPKSLFKKGVETNCNKSQPLAKKQWKLCTLRNLKHQLL